MLGQWLVDRLMVVCKLDVCWLISWLMLVDLGDVGNVGLEDGSSVRWALVG